jgi:hypothetical protein
VTSEFGPFMKLLQARRHLTSLSEQVNAYRGRTTYEFVRADNLREVTNRQVWAHWTFEMLEDVPSQEWGLRVGDVVHNLRGVLDHLAWQLALAHSGAAPSRPNLIQFPIYDDPTRFQRGAAATLAAIAPSAGDALEAMQPYHATEQDPSPTLLSWLQYLSNADKHRVLTVAGLHTFEDIPVDVQPPPADLTVAPFVVAGAQLTDGADLVRIEFTRPDDSMEMVATPRIVHAESVQVSDAPLVLPLGIVMESLITKVVDVFDEMVKHLPAPTASQ